MGAYTMVVWCNGSTWCCGFSSTGLHEDGLLQALQSPLQSGFDSQHRQLIYFLLFFSSFGVVVMFLGGCGEVLGEE